MRKYGADRRKAAALGRFLDVPWPDLGFLKFLKFFEGEKTFFQSV